MVVTKTTSFTNINFIIKEHIGYISINYPPANTLGTATLNGLSECIDYVEIEDSIKAIIITGEGRFFIA